VKGENARRATPFQMGKNRALNSALPESHPVTW
jgi:hypothetical protein